MRVARRHEQARAAVGPNHFGQRAGGIRDHGQAARHRLAGWEAEALEERRHHRDAPGRVFAHEVGHFQETRLEDHALLELKLPNQPRHEPVGRDAAVDDLQRHTLGQERERLEQRADAFLAVLGAAHEQQVRFLRDRVGMEEFGIGAVVNHGDVFLRNPEVLLDLAARGLAHGHDLVEPLRDLLLHEEREVERAADFLDEPRIDREIRFAIEVQRVVDHRDHRHAELANAEQAPGQALIIEHDVEAVPLVQLAPTP